MYSDIELEQIRDVIGGKISIDENRLAKLKKAVENNELNFNMFGSLASLYDTELFKKISEDEMFKELNIFGLFPETYQSAYIDRDLKYSYTRAGRGIIFFNQTKNLVIKPVQSSQEKSIADKAALIGGPIQYATINNYLTEELLDGEQLNRIHKYDIGKMTEHGREIGILFKKLHEDNIIYNDFSISDDMGNCHIIIGKKARLYDFGVSIDVSNHPNYNDDEIISYYRTLPLGDCILRTSDEMRQIMINRCREDLKKINKYKIKQKDNYFIDMGLKNLYLRVGSELTDAFEKGLVETYK